ncbi:putative E3 ubiquitin-protein ligase RING1a isoform X2 [Cynara cardunculus var. scolymus]|uniref:putative E3 ubiquitin-protein ligase RING1a isoform X2 n=1 Tax=Cynara cardunculus var. scolymus TaxID=59895 RepID=UPI000D62656E|nr:putative E3 ubiquitin-protein ligase RING1a isoform X2 [Cynara cardunculus var. scolymus]
MPAQKRSHEARYEDDDDDVDLQRNNPNIPEESEEDDDAEDVEQDEQESDDDGSASSSCSDKDEFYFIRDGCCSFVLVKLAEIRKEVQCPICLGIIRKTRTVMECLHRFCRECIDKSMRLGNNECPACRAHCASRRSLRDDPNYDALIAVLYPDIDKYEAEEFAFHEEEKARNKQLPAQIQASIAQTSRRQLEALGKKRTTAKATAAVFMRRSQGNTRNLRGRRNHKSSEPQGSDNEDDADNNDGGKFSSDADEPSSELRPKRHKRWRGARSSQPSLPSSSADGGCDENEVEGTRDMTGISAGLVGSSEILAWGRGGMRSHTRHGSLSNSAGKSARNSRLSKLIDHLRKLPQNNDKLDIHLKLISLDEQNIPNLQHLYLCCSPTMSIIHVSQYVALEKGLQDDEIELLLVKGDHFEINHSASLKVPTGEQPEPAVINPLTDELQLLEEHQTLLDVAKGSAQKDLTLAYRKKSCSS